MTGPNLTGSITALITPFSNGRVDEETFEAFVNWQIEEGTDGLVPVGTTGESPTLSHDEHKRVVELCVKAAGKRVPVVAGTGSNSTAEAIELTQHAQEAGADAALVVSPYYNKPNQNGLYAHFKAIHDASDLPIVLYNIPGRSIVDISVETMARLAELPRIIGVKDATSDLGRPWYTKAACGADFVQLSGEDGTILPFMAMGGHGCISVTANLAPRLCGDFHDAWSAGDMDKAREINDRLMPLHKALFMEPSPQPVKYGLALIGKIKDELRLPLVNVSDETKKVMESAMKQAGLIN